MISHLSEICLFTHYDSSRKHSMTPFIKNGAKSILEINKELNTIYRTRATISRCFNSK